MPASTLSRLLTIFEDTRTALSIGTLARELDVSPGRVQGLVDFWIRKGKIKVSQTQAECGACSSRGNCPFVLEMPKTYELVGDQDPARYHE